MPLPSVETLVRAFIITARNSLTEFGFSMMPMTRRREEREAAFCPCSVSMITGAREPRRTAPSITTDDDHPFSFGVDHNQFGPNAHDVTQARIAVMGNGDGESPGRQVFAQVAAAFDIAIDQQDLGSLMSAARHCLYPVA